MHRTEYRTSHHPLSPLVLHSVINPHVNERLRCMPRRHQSLPSKLPRDPGIGFRSLYELSLLSQSAAMPARQLVNGRNTFKVSGWMLLDQALDFHSDEGVDGTPTTTNSSGTTHTSSGCKFCLRQSTSLTCKPLQILDPRGRGKHVCLSTFTP